MDILLAHGYFLFEDPHEKAVMKPYPPLGILYLSSHLKNRGFEVAVFDSTFSSLEAFRRQVNGEKPTVVGLYCNMLTRSRTLEMVRICRESGAIVITGGPDPANYPEEYLSRGADVVVEGEGEKTLEELLPHLALHGLDRMEEVPGIFYRGDDGGVLRTDPRPYLAELDAQPIPDRDAVDIGRYLQLWRQHHGSTALSLITARGCPYNCAWCSHAVFGHTHRRRSPKKVADELEMLVGSYHPDKVWYADDVFTLNRDWLMAYAEELKTRGLRVPFETTSREDLLDEEVIGVLKEMGCFRLWIGVESGSRRVLESMDRRCNPDRARKMVHLLQSRDIEAGVFIMLGYQGEETPDLEATTAFLKGANPDSFLTTLAYPVKGTPYYRKVADRVIALKPWEEGSDRDNTVEGRHSRRFYRFATRWMVGEVGWHKQRLMAPPKYGYAARCLFKSAAGRLGMWMTQFEREQGN